MRHTFVNRGVAQRIPAFLFAAFLLSPLTGCGLNEPGINPSETARPVNARGDLAEDEQTTIAVFRNNTASVVHVTTVVDSQPDILEPDLDNITAKTGSGFVWDEQGHIVTNYHVMEDGEAVRVVLADRSAWEATPTGAYPDEDIAVLHIDAPASQLKPILLGSSKDLQVGQDTFAIGNPFGLDHTLTKGIVSAMGRRMTSETGHPMKDMIQTDAAINPGNSGGPLLDSAGRLIGMNSSIVSPSGAFAGIGFALPADEIDRVVTQLIKQGKMTRPGLGLQLAPKQWASELQMPGVLVVHVVPGSPAQKAGVEPMRRLPDGRIALGDSIVSIEQQSIQSRADYFNVLESHKIDDVLAVTVLRDGRKKTFHVKLVAM